MKTKSLHHFILCVLFYTFSFFFNSASVRAAQTPFERMDINSDRRLSEKEYQGSKRLFQRLDKNRDNYINYTEAKGTELMEEGNSGKRVRPGKATLQKNVATNLLDVDTQNSQTPFERLDLNGDRRLSEKEYQGSKRLFQRLDKNRDKYINYTEAKGTELMESQ